MKMKENVSAKASKKVDEMTFYECINFIKNGVASTFGMLPKKYSEVFMSTLTKLENDYKKCEEERDAALKQLNGEAPTTQEIAAEEKNAEGEQENE